MAVNPTSGSFEGRLNVCIVAPSLEDSKQTVLALKTA
jgi:hypothetical protein